MTGMSVYGMTGVTGRTRMSVYGMTGVTGRTGMSVYGMTRMTGAGLGDWSECIWSD